MNKKQCEELIGKISDKTLSFGCLVRCTKTLSSIRKGKVLVYSASGKLTGNKHKRVVLFSPKAKKPRDKAVTPLKEIWLDYYEIVGHPVFVGDVLKRIYELDEQNEAKDTKILWQPSVLYGWNSQYTFEKGLLVLWQECDLAKSLNQIMQESGFEEYQKKCGPSDQWPPCGCDNSRHYNKQLKDPNARKLFEFLKSVLS